MYHNAHQHSERSIKEAQMMSSNPNHFLPLINLFKPQKE